MARIARIVIPRIPHHITQRGNRRQDVFFQKSDYESYISLLMEWCDRYGVEIWAYCLMPNHVHLIAVPQTEAFAQNIYYINLNKGAKVTRGQAVSATD